MKLLDTAIMWMATSRKQVTNGRIIAVFSRVNAFYIEYELIKSI